MSEERWTEVCYTVQEAVNKTIKMKKESKKAKWQEALQIAKERREAKIKGERDRYTKLNADFQRTARRDKKAFFNEQCIKLEETTEEEILEISSGKLEISREYFSQRWAQQRTETEET